MITNDVAARLPLSVYWDDYLPSIKVRLRPSSVRDYSYSWSKWIEPRFGDVPVSKTGRDRWVALPASLVAQLRELLRDRPINADTLLFPNADGGYRRARVTDRHHRIKAVKAWNASRVDEEERLLDPIAVGFHHLRSVCASLLIDAGASPKDVQAHLGHASIQTTLEIYARVRPERSADLAQRLDALIDEGVKARPRRGESAEKV